MTLRSLGYRCVPLIVWAGVALHVPRLAFAEHPLVEDNVGCFRPKEVQGALGQVLVKYPGSENLAITVVASPGEQATIATLRAVSPRGEVVLERTFAMNAKDCAIASEVFSTVLDAFLRTMPATAWETPKPAPVKPRTKTVVVERLVTQSSSFGYVSADTRWQGWGGDLEVGLLFDVGSQRHRIATSGAVRVTTPTALGRGKYFEGYALLGVGWSVVGDHWLLRSEVRTGGLLAYGYGFDTSKHSWLPWLEGQISALARWKRSLVGIQIGISPLNHDITASGAESQIPQVRIGVTWAKPLF